MAGRCSAKTRAGHKTSIEDGKVHPWADSEGIILATTDTRSSNTTSRSSHPSSPAPGLLQGSRSLSGAQQQSRE